MRDAEEGRFRWGWLASRVLHPIQVAVIEALLRIDMPLAPSDMALMFDGAHSVSHVSYHAKALVDLGVLRLFDTEAVRGATRHRYVLTPEARCG